MKPNALPELLARLSDVFKKSKPGPLLAELGKRLGKFDELPAAVEAIRAARPAKASAALDKDRGMLEALTDAIAPCATFDLSGVRDLAAALENHTLASLRKVGEAKEKTRPKTSHRTSPPFDVAGALRDIAEAGPAERGDQIDRLAKAKIQGAALAELKEQVLELTGNRDAKTKAGAVKALRQFYDALDRARGTRPSA